MSFVQITKKYEISDEWHLYLANKVSSPFTGNPVSSFPFMVRIFHKQYINFIRQVATLHCYRKSIMRCSQPYEVKRGENSDILLLKENTILFIIQL